MLSSFADILITLLFRHTYFGCRFHAIIFIRLLRLDIAATTRFSLFSFTLDYAFRFERCYYAAFHAFADAITLLFR